MPQVTIDVEGQVVYVSQYDGVAGGVRLRLGAVSTPSARELVLIAAASTDGRPLRGLLDVQASISRPGPDGAIDVCIGNAEIATRYRLARGAATAEKVGGECGQLVRGADGAAYLAVRGKPQLAILDETGKIARGLPLPGIAVLAAS